MIPDHELVAHARQGDSDAFCALLERHRIVALRVGYAIAGREAEDAVQEAMVKAFRHLDRFRAGSPFRPWFLAIVANEARNRRRVAGRQDAVELRLRARDRIGSHGVGTVGRGRCARARAARPSPRRGGGPLRPRSARSSPCGTSPG